MTYNQYLLICYLIYLGVVSLITFILFAVDKSRSKKDDNKRIKEKTLLLAVSLGGSIGAYLARVIIRHKTKKLYFSFIINLSLILSLIILGILFSLVIIG